jgi:hypothetical protein
MAKKEAIGYVEVDSKDRRQRFVSPDEDYLLGTKQVLENNGVDSDLDGNSLTVNELQKGRTTAWQAACAHGKANGDDNSLTFEHHGNKTWVTIFKILGTVVVAFMLYMIF